MKTNTEKEQCCGTCKWHNYVKCMDDYMCDNPDAEDYGGWTPYSYGDGCEQWEGRHG